MPQAEAPAVTVFRKYGKAFPEDLTEFSCARIVMKTPNKQLNSVLTT